MRKTCAHLEFGFRIVTMHWHMYGFGLEVYKKKYLGIFSNAGDDFFL